MRSCDRLHERSQFIFESYIAFLYVALVCSRQRACSRLVGYINVRLHATFVNEELLFILYCEFTRNVSNIVHTTVNVSFNSKVQQTRHVRSFVLPQSAHAEKPVFLVHKSLSLVTVEPTLNTNELLFADVKYSSCLYWRILFVHISVLQCSLIAVTQLGSS